MSFLRFAVTPLLHPGQSSQYNRVSDSWCLYYSISSPGLGAGFQKPHNVVMLCALKLGDVHSL